MYYFSKQEKNSNGTTTATPRRATPLVVISDGDEICVGLGAAELFYSLV